MKIARTVKVSRRLPCFFSTAYWAEKILIKEMISKEEEGSHFLYTASIYFRPWLYVAVEPHAEVILFFPHWRHLQNKRSILLL